MKTMLYITDLISKTNEENLHVYISLENYQKYLFTKKNDILIPVYNKEILDLLNNVSGICYSEKEKQKLTTKEKIEKALAILGVTLTLFATEPYFAEGLSYVLKRTHSVSHMTMVNADTTDKEFIEKFEECLMKNNDYKETEQKKIASGFKRYIEDWGYLLSEEDKEYILDMIENVKVNRNVVMPSWAAGDYLLKNINVKSEYDSTAVIIHETAHALSDRGLLVGTINGFGLGYALNEGINTTINNKYYITDNAYTSQCFDVFKLSLLVDKETLIKAYQKEGINHLINKICADISGIKERDIIKYISMMDIELFIDGYNMLGEYSLPSKFYKEKKELYNKMFKAKYGYDYKESWLGNNQSSVRKGFLSENVLHTKEEWGFRKIYSIPIEMAVQKASEVDINKYYKESEYSYSETMSMLDNEYIIENCKTSEEIYETFAKRYSDDPAEVEKIKLLFEEGITDKNFSYFMECITKEIISMSKNSEYIACYFKELNHIIKQECEIENLDTIFHEKMEEELIKRGEYEAIDLYYNSDIKFECYTSLAPSEPVLPKTYNIIEKTEDYVILNNNRIILKVADNESAYNGFFDDEKIIFSNIISEEEKEEYDKLFDSSDGKYNIGIVYNPENKELDRNKININKCHEVQIEEQTEYKTK